MLRRENFDFPGLNEMTQPTTSRDNLSTLIGFGRQDSLDEAALLQERDRVTKNCDFMETELDLENYLACFQDLDVPPDDVELNESELTKARLLYDNGHFSEDNNPFIKHAQYEQHTHQQFNRSEELYHPDIEVAIQNDYTKEKPEAQKKVPTPVKMTTRSVKRPQNFNYSEDWDDSRSSSDSEQAPPRRSTRNRKKPALSQKEFTPETVARNYKFKDQDEKAEPNYRMKRARNNDAVRKSRAKAKEIQHKKDEEYAQMKARIAELERLIEAEKSARQRDRETIQRLLGNNVQ